MHSLSAGPVPLRGGSSARQVARMATVCKPIAPSRARPGAAVDQDEGPQRGRRRLGGGLKVVCAHGARHQRAMCGHAPQVACATRRRAAGVGRCAPLRKRLSPITLRMATLGRTRSGGTTKADGMGQALRRAGRRNGAQRQQARCHAPRNQFCAKVLRFCWQDIQASQPRQAAWQVCWASQTGSVAGVLGPCLCAHCVEWPTKCDVSIVTRRCPLTESIQQVERMGSKRAGRPHGQVSTIPTGHI